MAETSDQQHSLVDRPGHPIFVFSYLANLTLVTANAATFVFADWVAWLSQNGVHHAHYTEELPGRVIQCGLLAAMLNRVILGRSIDRFGVRRVWQAMSLLTFAGISIFAAIKELSSWLYAGRILFATGLAGMFTCGTFHIQSTVSDFRRTEFIGLLGSSGFLGIILGAQLADLIRWMSASNPDVFFPQLFRAAIVLIGISIVLLTLATRQQTHGEHSGHAEDAGDTKIRPSMLRMMRLYWPGMVTVVAMVMGLAFTVPSLFLARFNQHEKFGGIAAYWTLYALTAFAFRVRTAKLSQQVGRYRLITIGLLAQGIGLWCLIPVYSFWHLLPSALLCGMGHALLFPSVVSLGSGTFPAKYRGSGTNLTLGCLDLGAAVSAPLLGRVIDLPMFEGVGFRPMFFVAGSVALLVAVVWHAVNHSSIDAEVG